MPRVEDEVFSQVSAVVQTTAARFSGSLLPWAWKTLPVENQESFPYIWLRSIIKAESSCDSTNWPDGPLLLGLLHCSLLGSCASLYSWTSCSDLQTSGLACLLQGIDGLLARRSFPIRGRRNKFSTCGV